MTSAHSSPANGFNSSSQQPVYGLGNGNLLRLRQTFCDCVKVLIKIDSQSHHFTMVQWCEDIKKRGCFGCHTVAGGLYYAGLDFQSGPIQSVTDSKWTCTGKTLSAQNFPRAERQLF